jgi:macrodomain Ter protein organizer (MatP/YcbG family)
MSNRKGVKGQKNIPIFYDEVKQRHTIVLTSTSWEKLKTLSKNKEVSISEFIEQLVRDTPD